MGEGWGGGGGGGSKLAGIFIFQDSKGVLG